MEGSTWYELQFYPQIYWTRVADMMIGRIHRRVLKHVRHLAELEQEGQRD